MRTLEQQLAATAKRIIAQKRIKNISDLCNYLNNREEYPLWADNMANLLNLEILDSDTEWYRSSDGNVLRMNDRGE
ncbi:MAG: hypothetical protein Q3998_06180, partial [Porphyromonas sp.]|nr:hypothetical protein [Porphyromonas sp.]